jgi:SAM-dependent methyltransferase
VPPEVDLYDGHYGHLETDAQRAVRRETYDVDLGQASWITLAEAREWFRLLELSPGRTALEIACGSGGMTERMARETGASCVGVDINANGIDAARARARDSDVASRVSFQLMDAAKTLPFPDRSFDAIFCNDAINHLPGRLDSLRDWNRVLRPGGRLLFTDPVVITGPVSTEEIRVRSSIGFFLFTPAGLNEKLLVQAGFSVREVRDVTEAVASISGKWRDARAKRREALVQLEGEAGFDDLQAFLGVVHALSSERRLSRYMYLSLKPAS